ncbi:MAG TPA: PRC-barrel domain-containing protein [Candidatus Angelobacter sp.]|nr:PRC-barrel domain-containing protein [Candidatus Angelobacter sp.]
MPHYGTLHETRFGDTEEIRGAEVYGVNDEKLGKIDDVIFDHSTGDIRYIVVDTGGWLTSKKFLVPVGRISPYGNHDDKFYAELDKERIQMLPEYDEKKLGSETDWTDYEKRYEEGWKTGTVMYNERTGHTVTPPANEVQGTRTSALSEEGKQSLQRDFTPEKRGHRDDLWGVAPSGDDVTLRPNKAPIAGREDAILAERDQKESRENVPGPDAETLKEPGVYRVDKVPQENADRNQPPAANYGPRYIAFQRKLHEGRDRVVSGCPLCGSQKKVA